MDIKIITGFRENQYYAINDQETHKAYYLFNNPEMRGVFKNGVALVGKNVQGIEPALNETMGWNPTYKLGDDDWNEIRQKGIDKKFQILLQQAKDIADLAEKNPALLEMPLDEAVKLLPERKIPNEISNRIKKL